MVFRHRRMLAPIVSRKHIAQVGVTPTAVGAITNLVIAEAKDTPVNTAPTEVRIGSVIKAVYIEMWTRGDDETAPPANVQINFEKLIGSSTLQIFAEGVLLNTYDNKSNVFYTTQGLTSAGTANSGIPFLRGWFKIPKGFQRMSIGDRLVLNIVALNHDLESCGIFVYKEYQ